MDSMSWNGVVGAKILAYRGERRGVSSCRGGMSWARMFTLSWDAVVGCIVEGMCRGMLSWVASWRTCRGCMSWETSWDTCCKMV